MPAATEMIRVRKTFPKRGGGEPSVALDGVDFSVAEGEFFCLLGPTGCGKSTVLHLIAGFETADGGRVSALGRPVDGPSAERGVVFQSELALFPWLTVQENVEYGPRARAIPADARDRVVAKNLELVGLTEHRSKFPRELSGGMKQRVQIARVLANDCKILLMDEPFGALDAQTRAHMQRELADIWSNTRQTVVFVTHDVAEAIWLADRIGVMTAGPGSRIKTIISNPLERPRDRMTPLFIEMFNRLTDELDSTVGARSTHA